MRIGAIIQARASSTRLPNKVLKKLPYNSKITILQQVIRRIKKSNLINVIIVATTLDKKDQAIIDLTKKENVKWFKGSKKDVLERYYLAAKDNNLDIIVRITSDCPCLDPEVIDLVIEKHLKTKADYTSNIAPRTFPHGLDTEVFNFSTLEKVHKEAKKDFEREHVCPYVYESKPHLFKIASVKAPKYFLAPDIRVTVDTEEDYALLCAIYDYLFHESEYFSTKNIIQLFRKKPWLKLINKKVAQKKVCKTLKCELKEAASILGMQDLKRAQKVVNEYLLK